MSRLDNVAALVRTHIAGVVPAGGRVVDATAGNGLDTLFLARLVGPGGTVWAFDIQPEALSRTRRLLRDEGAEARVRLIHAGHEEFDRHVSGTVDAVMFNLGYLPRGPHDVTTKAETTLTALRMALAALRPEGRVSVVCYPGHPEGARETAAVETFCGALPPRRFAVVTVRVLNRQGRPPRAIIIEKVSAEE